MPLFQYIAKNKEGKKIKGQVFAQDLVEARTNLEKNELSIQNLKPIKDKQSILKMSFGTVSFKDKIIFLKYLSVVLKSGLTIKKSLEILGSRVKNKYFAGIINSIRESIENGQSFHQSLKRYPRVFSALFVSLIAVGEVSGNLAQVITYLEDLLQKDYRFKKTIKGAMAYPLVVLILVVAVTVGLVKFIIPRITKIFANFDVKLPFLTRALISFEAFLTKYWLLVILAVVIVVGTYIALMRIREIRKTRDMFFLKIPFLKSLIKQVQVTRFSHTVSTLLTSGIGLVEALQITANTIDNLVFKDSFQEASKYVETGGLLSDFFDQREDLYEPMLGQMIKLGETTGSIDEILNTVSALYEDEVNDKIKLISSLLGPILLIIMAMFVGAVAISIITPIYQLPTLIQNR